MVFVVYSSAALVGLNKALDELSVTAIKALEAQGFASADIRVKRFLNLRYEGTDTAMFTTLDENGWACSDRPALLPAFSSSAAA
jgi:N-methylhydantoinase A/oxoprolinase/acetone carboxylase beta subunit